MKTRLSHLINGTIYSFFDISVYIRIYTCILYIYLSVDIYECMSNVSITCRYRQYVLSPYISCYICICFFILSVPQLSTCTLVFKYNVHVKILRVIVIFLITIVQKLLMTAGFFQASLGY